MPFYLFFQGWLFFGTADPGLDCVGTCFCPLIDLRFGSLCLRSNPDLDVEGLRSFLKAWSEWTIMFKVEGSPYPLVVVDPVRGCCGREYERPEWNIYFSRVRGTIPRLNDFVERYRGLGGGGSSGSGQRPGQRSTFRATSTGSIVRTLGRRSTSPRAWMSTPSSSPG